MPEARASMVRRRLAASREDSGRRTRSFFQPLPTGLSMTRTRLIEAKMVFPITKVINPAHISAKISDEENCVVWFNVLLSIQGSRGGHRSAPPRKGVWQLRMLSITDKRDDQAPQLALPHSATSEPHLAFHARSRLSSQPQLLDHACGLAWVNIARLGPLRGSLIIVSMFKASVFRSILNAKESALEWFLHLTTKTKRTSCGELLKSHTKKAEFMQECSKLIISTTPADSSLLVVRRYGALHANRADVRARLRSVPVVRQGHRAAQPRMRLSNTNGYDSVKLEAGSRVEIASAWPPSVWHALSWQHVGYGRGNKGGGGPGSISALIALAVVPAILFLCQLKRLRVNPSNTCVD